MKSVITRLWRTHRIILIAFVVAVGAAGFFGFKSAAAYVYWMDPAHQDQRIEGWMTPRYIANSYKIPPDVLGDVLFIERGAPRQRVRLATIADENGLTLDALQERIDAATAAFRAEKGADR